MWRHHLGVGKVVLFCSVVVVDDVHTTCRCTPLVPPQCTQQRIPVRRCWAIFGHHHDGIHFESECVVQVSVEDVELGKSYQQRCALVLCVRSMAQTVGGLFGKRVALVQHSFERGCVSLPLLRLTLRYLCHSAQGRCLRGRCPAQPARPQRLLCSHHQQYASVWPHAPQWECYCATGGMPVAVHIKSPGAILARVSVLWLHKVAILPSDWKV